MDSYKFLNTVLPNDGWYFLLAIQGTDDDKVVRQRPYNCINSLIEAASKLDKQDYDTYFATSSFVNEEGRLQKNVKSTKCLYMDIDCGEKYAVKNKGYIDQTTAWKALKAFCKGNKLPAPTVVNSGRGLHVYWALTEAVPPEHWIPVAEALKELALRDGLLCDPAVSADSARVLRIPQTHNHKDTPPSEVKVYGDEVKLHNFDDLSEVICGAMPEPVIMQANLPSNLLELGLSVNNKLAGYNENFKNNFKRILEKTVEGKGCKQLEIIAMDQANIEEPLWRAGLSIAKFCENGRAVAHKLSCRHDDYSESATDKKFDGIEGPHSCETFNGLNPGVCEECPNWGKMKSPIVLGREFVGGADDDDDEKVSTSTDLALAEERMPCPEPFAYGKKGGIFKKIINADGDETAICIFDHQLYILDRVHDNKGIGECAVFQLILPQDGSREFTIPLTDLQSPTELRRELVKEGVLVSNPHNWKDIEQYVYAALINHQLTKKAKPLRRQFGFSQDRLSFAIGDTVYRANAEPVHNYPAPMTGEFFPAFEKKGTLDGWKYVAKCYSTPGMELRQLMILVGLGSILMEFVDAVHCCGWHIFSKGSGIGKTSALDTVLTPWGNPELVRTKNNDTHNFRMNRCEVYKNLPFSIDEMTNADPIILSQQVYDVTAGQQRGRMQSSSNKERKRGDPWSFFSITTANTSLLDQIALGKNDPNAESQRVIECLFEAVPWDVDPNVFNETLVNNYGHAGPIFVQYVLDNIDTIKEEVMEYRNKAIKRFKLKDENRFWSAAFGIVWLTNIICKRIDLLDFDMEPLLNYMGKVVERNQMNLANNEQDSDDLISEYLGQYSNGIIRTSNSSDNKLAGYKTEAAMNSVIRGRYDPSTHSLWLDYSLFKTWLAERQAGDSATLSKLCTEFNAQILPKYTLTTGTTLAPVRKKVIFIENYEQKD